MLIVISNPLKIHKEAALINALFGEGLELLHLRKPAATAEDIRSLLAAIDPLHYPRIALHQHHSVADEFGIKRLHFTEAARRVTEENTLRQLRKANVTVSTSIHQTDDHAGLSPCFAYTFFGPVFSSISKYPYTSSITEGFTFPVRPDLPGVIAIGGIRPENIRKAMAMQFNGVAALGTVWQHPHESVQRFKALQKAWKQTEQ